MSRKNKIIISISGIVIVLLLLLGLTYGFYLTRINGNSSDKSVTVSLANLELTYSDGNGLVESNNMVPGESITKTFTVENTGNKKVINYLIYLEDVVNTFEDKNDLKVTLTCTSNNGTCNGNTLTYPSSDTVIGVNDIEVKEKQEFSLKVEFLETNDNQNDNQNKKFSGNVKLKDMKSTSSEIVSNEGENILEINNAKAINHLLVYGNSTQEVRSGKNLAKISSYNRSSTTTLISDTNGVYRVKGNDGENPISWSSGNINILFDNLSTANKTITVSFYATRYNDGVWKSSSDSVTQIRLEGVDSSNASSYNLTNYDNYPIGEKTLLKATFTPTFDVAKIVFFLNGMEWEIDTNTVQIEEGSTATDYEAYGETPSPDIPSEIDSVGDLVTDTSDTNYGKYKIPVTASSKNLLEIYGFSTGGMSGADSNKTLSNNYGTTISTINPSNELVVTQTKTDNPSNPTNYTNGYFTVGVNNYLEVDKEYKISMDIDIKDNPLNVSAFMGLVNGNKSFTFNVVDGQLQAVFTWNKNGSNKYIEIRCAGASFTISNFMITEKEEDYSYVPYKKETTNIYLDEPLRKIGDKSDYIDLKNGKVVRNIKNILLSTSLNKFYFSSNWNNDNYTTFYFLPEGFKKDTFMSNYFNKITGYGSNINEEGYSSSTNNDYLYFKILKSRASDNATLNTWLDGKKVNISGVLEEPINENISLPSILTDESTKTIEIGTNTKPSKTQIEYVQ